MYPFPSDTGETPPSGKTRITYAELRYVAPFDNPRVDRFAHNWFVLREQADHKARTQAGELLEAIRSDEATTKLGRIPNLLTMMALIFRVRARLPHGRALLYSEIAQAYLETIDGWRRILSRPETLPERRRWLARIGFEMQRKRVASGDSDGKELLATGDEVRGWVAAAMADGGREGSDEDAADFVDYLAKRSGLLLPRGQDQFAFLHLSFQEYFAAVFLQNQIASPAWLMEGDRVAAGAAKDDLQAYAGETVWRETLVFLVELVAASEQPMWLEPILDALFGQNFDGISAEIRDSISQSRTLLLARLAIDPHGGFSANRRQRAIDVCCGREVQLMAEWNKRQMGVLYSTDVLRVLIGAEPNERRTILPAIKEHIVAQKTLVLNLDGTRVSDVSSLSGLTWLQMLWLGRTGVSDVSCLSRLTSLQTLYLHCTDVSDVSGLSGLTSLQTLTLGDTSVSDVSCLSGLTSLQTLYLENTGVNDVSSLSGLTSLEKLYLHGTGVTAEQVAAFHEARKQRGLPACSVTH